MTFSPEAFVGKLAKLVDTQDSINLLSHCELSPRLALAFLVRRACRSTLISAVIAATGLIHHRKNAAESVAVWAAEFAKTSTARKLTFLHLANDVLQVARKKAEDFSREFARVLPVSLKLFSSHANDELRAKTRRMLTIWEERGVYPREFVAELKGMIGGTDSGPSSSKTRPVSASPAKTPGKPPIAPNQSHAQHSDTVKSILQHTESIKHLHTNRVHLERTISTAEPSLDPVTVTSQVNALTVALSAELNERKKLIEELTRWIKVEEAACAKILSVVQDLSLSQNAMFIDPTPSPTTSFNSAAQPNHQQQGQLQQQQQRQEQRDFDSTTPVGSPTTSPKANLNPMAFIAMGAIPPPPPPPMRLGSTESAAPAAQPGGNNSSSDASAMTGALANIGGISIPPDLLFAAQNAIQNNEPGSNEVFNLLSGLSGGGGLFGSGGDSGGF
ncbi:Regulation of nuclear pre-mRNA domain containing protein 1B [Entophlyctis luteolus]|nr:Regulation of nuclear pre-mRNA domain containing protein 1B [Entophlyctis luteolus]KAJ3394699.1 Regulation of nuclear pre-mRNA domain containing protein 1B [Entophlyctis sp. JEL0112]